MHLVEVSLQALLNHICSSKRGLACASDPLQRLREITVIGSFQRGLPNSFEASRQLASMAGINLIFMHQPAGDEVEGSEPIIEKRWGMNGDIIWADAPHGRNRGIQPQSVTTSNEYPAARVSRISASSMYGLPGM